MKIAGRAGHNVLSLGASALVDEVKENRPIFYASKKYLEKNHTFIDCTPEPVANQSLDLYYGINKANNAKADLLYSVHLNKAYNRYDGAIGAEIWLHPNATQATIAKAKRILSNFAALGFINRGIKWGDNRRHRYGEIYETNCAAMIIECFFLEATKDVELYKIVGAEALGFAIANGIDPSITKGISTQEVEKTIDYEKELCRIIVNGNNVIALTGKTKCINYAKTNYEGTIRIQCVKDNAILAEFENKLPKTQTIVYPVVPSKPIGKEKVEFQKTPIVGASDLTKGQMLKYLLDNNKEPKLTVLPEELISYFLEEGAFEGIRGDIAFCQSIKETGFFKFGGQVLSEQNNFSGIGATNDSPIGKGAWFFSAREGVRAQIQHLKAYATTEQLRSEVVDPRFNLVNRGSALNWEDLNGKWAVPGEGYGESIIKIYQAIKLIKEVPMPGIEEEFPKDKGDILVGNVNVPLDSKDKTKENNVNYKNKEVKEAKYSLWQIILKFFINIINRLFKKNSSQ